MTDETSESLAIVFADVSGSVALFDSMGDLRAFEMIKSCVKVMTEEVTRKGGTLVKTIGDEVMCTFPSADEALEAAVSVQTRIEADVTGNLDVDTSGLQVRIGANFGPVIHQDMDIFGDAVNVAARMVGLAKGGQIVLTGHAVEQLSEMHFSRAQLMDHMNVKGKREPIEVYVYIWDDEDVTKALTITQSKRAPEARLSLRYHGLEVNLDHDSEPILIGRGTQADLQVADANASRLHVRIEYNRGKFLITDDSVNGTYLSTPSGEVRLRKKESIALTGRGMISLGRAVSKNPEIVIYECK